MDVQFLIDVRSIPHSRYQPSFSKDALQTSVLEYGVKYVFMGDDLGGRPSDRDCYVAGKVDYARVRQRDFFRRGIGRLISAVEQGYRVCLMCSESLPCECHRSKLIGSALLEHGVQSLHLLSDGSVQTQEEVISKLVGSQPDLFGQTFTSRKTYI
jgi:uncharacterized protein (DUF488 family)